MPVETHLKSALGLGSHAINTYHHLQNPADKEAVYERYLANFAEHRISPYSFYDYAPIGIRFPGQGTNKQAQVDFTRFDRAAERWLDGARFNTFQLRMQGMGGGTFHSRHLGELEGFKEGTPEFARLFGDYLSQIETHLRERNWLSKAYTYWFDEPAPKDFEFVVEGMKRLHAARRDFLKLMGAAGTALTFAPFVPWGKFMPNPDSAKLEKVPVILPDGGQANVNTFPTNHAEVITYPSTGDRVLDEEAFRKWLFIRLPERVGWSKK